MIIAYCLMSLLCLVGLTVFSDAYFGPLSAAVTKSWNGDVAASQEQLMQSDICILVDEKDNIIGHDSKINCHKFNEKYPTGRLHRAFSIFLFNTRGELLLQQRASDKLTFPSVWTNTCCSHPLFNPHLQEIDFQCDIQQGRIPGILRAATRKLQQELGIPIGCIDHQKYHFLTRIKYCSADSQVHKEVIVEENSEQRIESSYRFGEHELDYILFVQQAEEDVPLTINPEEIAQTKYVTADQLQKMLQDPQYQWSPWFSLLAKNFLFDWWKQLDNIMMMPAEEEEKKKSDQNLGVFDWKIIHNL